MMAKYFAVLTLALCLASAAAFVPSASFKLGSPALAGRCALAPALRQVPPRVVPAARPRRTCIPSLRGRTGTPAGEPRQWRPTGQHNIGLHPLLDVAGAGAMAAAPRSIVRRVIGVWAMGVRRGDSVWCSPDLQSSTKAVLGLTMQQDDPLKLFVGGLPWALTSDDLREVRSCSRVGAIACRVLSTYASPLHSALVSVHPEPLVYEGE